MRSEIDHPEFPDGIGIFGSDDAAQNYYMLHFDERGVSRKYEVSVEGNGVKWWRDDSKFSQRFSMTLKEDGNEMVSSGEMSKDGAEWEKDLALTYLRVK